MSYQARFDNHDPGLVYSPCMGTINILINPHAGGGRAARLVLVLQEWIGTEATPGALGVAGSVPQALDWLRALPRGATGPW